MTSNVIFTIGVPVKKAASDLVTVFKKYIFCPNNSIEPKINVRSMPKWSDFGQLRPKWINGLILGSIIGPFELIFNPHIEKHKT